MRVEARPYTWNPPRPEPVWRDGPQQWHQPEPPTIGDSRGVNLHAGEVGLFHQVAVESIERRFGGCLAPAAWSGPRELPGFSRGDELAIKGWTKAELGME